MNNLDALNQLGIKVTASSGQQKTTCPACSHLRDKTSEACLSVNIDKGVWKCHHCNWEGSVSEKGRRLKVWHELEHKNFYLRKATKEEQDIDRFNSFFINRGISQFTLSSNNVYPARWKIEGEENVLCAVFPYKFGDTIVQMKARSLDGKKYAQSKGGEAIFYRMEFLSGQSMAIITEGEIDALSCVEAGFLTAISIPKGAPNPKEDPKKSQRLSFLDDCMPYMRSIKRIIVFVDNDKNGLILQDELIRRFGIERCYLVNRPHDCKDANDVLVKYGKKALQDVINNAYIAPISGYTKPNDYKSHVRNLFKYGYPEMATLGLESFDKHLRFLQGAVTLITGHPGKGKSTFLNYLTVSLCSKYNWKFLFYTPENYPPHYHIAELASQLTAKQVVPGKNQMTELEFETACDVIENHIAYLEPEEYGAYTLEQIIEKSVWAVENYGINSLVIDPFNKIKSGRGRNETELEYMNRVLTMLVAFSRKKNVHVFLVAHPTKQSATKDKPSKTLDRIETIQAPVLNDVAGTKDFVAMVDNGIVVHSYYDGVAQCDMAEFSFEKIRYKFTGRVGKAIFRFDPLTSSYFETKVEEHNKMPYEDEPF